MNDDEFGNTSPDGTLSNFWANRKNATLQHYQHINLRVFNRPDKSVNHVINSRLHLQLLDHKAAKHKIAVKPKRKYPQPRKKKVEPNDKCGYNKDSNYVATVNLCGAENGSPQQNSLDVSQSKTKSEPEKLGSFLQRIIGVKKLAAKNYNNKNVALKETNKTTDNYLTEHKVAKIRTKKKRPPPPPPPSYTKPELVTMNVKTINHDSGSGWYMKQFLVK